MDQHLEHLHLTFLTLSPSLYLLWMNLAPQSVFESPLLYATHASWMFERGGTHDERRDGSGEQSDLRSKLEELAQAGDRATVWGRGTSLACWAGDGLQRKAHRAEVVVQSFDADGSYSPPTDVSLALSLDAVKSKGYFARVSSSPGHRVHN